ncbi:MAG TPA: hypothetical protein VHE81_19830 [Lacipirellulaceae bacterium]|nr:hypothetical protein [Lacipirellulaceae bacterium]
MHNSIQATAALLPLGHYPFDWVLRSNNVVTAASALAETYRCFPDPYNDTVDLLDDSEWRLLAVSHHIHWAQLCDAAFDPRPELMKLATEAATSGCQPEWIGNDPAEVVLAIKQDLAHAYVDPVRAAWLILSFVQSKKLPLTDIAVLRFWEAPVWSQLLRG